MKKLSVMSALSAAALLLTSLPSVPAHADAIPANQRGYAYKIGAHSALDFTVTYRGGETAKVWLNGRGDVDLYVLYDKSDDKSDAIVSDSEPDWTPYCAWVPTYTHTYTIRVVNCEDHAITFDFSTN